MLPRAALLSRPSPHLHPFYAALRAQNWLSLGHVELGRRGGNQHVNPPAVVSRVDVADVQVKEPGRHLHKRSLFNARRVKLLLRGMPYGLEGDAVRALSNVAVAPTHWTWL